MRSAWPIVAILSFGSACATDEEEHAPTAVTIDVPGIDETYAIDLADEAPEDICTRLPAEGPCALACDPQALGEQYVPTGACAAFSCTLTDGTQIAVHACHIGS